MPKEIKQTWFFRQSPREVWEYLTKPELIEQWLMKNDFQPIVGHKFRFTFIPKKDSEYEGTVHCEVLEVT
ncbi:MAG TPA: SRPBCC domain-containing protein, partial [Chitinophagaceae bacterium]|nr:SRPBCC domain-containing protein [Chitinophagaceae bacterium]